MVETNILEGLRNNVLGTRIVAMAARNNNVGQFILISSDKAVRPTSWLGLSKRFAEIIVQDLATRSETTIFSMVRFGNVFGSSGSVVPLFHEQIAAGGPVTVTHPDVVRYFMSIPEAVQLVLLAARYASGGDIFVLKMGEPVKILDVAKRLILATGNTIQPFHGAKTGIEIQFTGLRKGEKLKEELFYGDHTAPTPHSKILRAQEMHPSEIEVAKLVRTLTRIVDEGDEAAAENVKELHSQMVRNPDTAINA